MTHRYQHQEVLSGDQSYEITGYNYRSHLWHSIVKSGVNNIHPPVKDMQQFCQWQFVNRKEVAKPHFHSFLSHSRSISAPMPLIANVFVNVFFNVFLSLFANVFVNVFGKALFAPFFPTVG